MQPVSRAKHTTTHGLSAACRRPHIVMPTASNCCEVRWKPVPASCSRWASVVTVLCVHGQSRAVSARFWERSHSFIQSFIQMHHNRYVDLKRNWVRSDVHCCEIAESLLHSHELSCVTSVTVKRDVAVIHYDCNNCSRLMITVQPSTASALSLFLFFQSSCFSPLVSMVTLSWCLDTVGWATG